MDTKELFGKVIFSYTRARAIEDGVLVDLTKLFPEVTRCYRYPVACTDTVWNMVEQGLREAPGTDATGIVHDLMQMSQKGIYERPAPDTVYFNVIIAGVNDGRPVQLKMHCGPSDDLSPCMTLMTLHED